MKTKNTMQGTVKFFNDSKAFGFITGSDGKDIFVHKNGCKQSIKEGDQVEFDTEQGKKGLNAVNVRRA